jgi:chromate transporter
MEQVSLRSLGWVFLKYGLTGFGGPAVVIAMMEEDIVEKNGWMGKDQFLDLVGATNLIPGPNSTEMAIHIGYIMRGWVGLAIAGASFIVPSVVITLFFAWLYVTLGTLPELEILFFGIRPAVIAVILGAVYRLGKKAAKGWQLLVLGAVIIPIAYLFGQYTVLILLGGGIVGMLWLQATSRSKKMLESETESVIENPDQEEEGLPSQYTSNISRRTLVIFSMIAILIWGSLGFIFGLLTFLFPEVILYQIGFFFYGVGSVLYGSGYVLVAYIRTGLVEQYGWLNEQQLLDSVAIGQFTPGPILSTSAAIGFIIDGYGGALIATFGIFFPSFLVVVVLNPILLRLRDSEWAGHFLDSVNMSAIAVMLVISLRLGEGLLIGLDLASSIVTLLLMAGAILIVVFSKRLNSAVIVIGAATVGALLKLFFL